MMRARKYLMIAPAALVLFVGACGRVPEAEQLTVTLDKGTELRVKPLKSLSPVTEKSGDEFTATLESPLMAGNQVAVPVGATVVGKVVEASGPAAADQEAAYLTLKLHEIIAPGGKSINIETEPFRFAPPTASMSPMEGAQEQTQPEPKAESAPEATQPPMAAQPDDSVMTFHLSEAVEVPVVTDQGQPKPVS